MKKMEVIDQTSSRGSVSSASGSSRFKNVKTSSWVTLPENMFRPQSETKLEEEPHPNYSNDEPCSSKQAKARTQLLTKTAPWTTTDNKLRNH